MKASYFALFCSLLLASCAPFQQKTENLTAERNDGIILAKKADDLFASNNVSLAKQYYLDAFRKFSLVDNIEGKARVLSSLVKVEASLNNGKEADSLLRLLGELLPYHSSAGHYYVRAALPFLQKRQDYAAANVLIERYLFSKDAETRILVVAYKMNSDNKKMSPGEAALFKELLDDNEDHLLQTDPLLLSFARYSLAAAYLRANDYQPAQQQAERALEIDKGASYSAGIVTDLTLLGDILRRAGDYQKAQGYYSRAIDVFQALYKEQPGIELSVKRAVAEYLNRPDERNAAALRKLLSSDLPSDLRKIAESALR